MAPPAIPNRYAEVHKSPNGAGDARPTALQVLKDNDLIGDKLSDKTILVTGGTDGIGLESVRQLVKTGARVFFTARNEEKARRVVEKLTEEMKSNEPSTKIKLDWVKMDNSSLQSVKEGAEAFLEKSKQLNVLLCNAGIANTPYGLTEDGFELQFGVNYLAHFYLFHLLKPLLLASSTPLLNSRVVAVASGAHGFSTVHIGNYNLSTKPTSGYDPMIELEGEQDNPMIAYGHSKTATIWLTNEIERRYGTQGLHGISLHPGNIITAIFGIFDPRVTAKLSPILEIEAFQKAFKSVEQGAATQMLAAVGKDYEAKGGFYMDDCGVARRLADDEQMGLDGYRPWAYDEENARQLWKDSLGMLGLEDV